MLALAFNQVRSLFLLRSIPIVNVVLLMFPYVYQLFSQFCFPFYLLLLSFFDCSFICCFKRHVCVFEIERKCLFSVILNFYFQSNGCGNSRDVRIEIILNLSTDILWHRIGMANVCQRCTLYSCQHNKFTSQAVGENRLSMINALTMHGQIQTDVGNR